MTISTHHPPSHILKCHIHRILGISRDADSITALFQCLATLSMQKYLQISNLNLPYNNSRLFPLIPGFFLPGLFSKKWWNQWMGLETSVQLCRKALKSLKNRFIFLLGCSSPCLTSPGWSWKWDQNFWLFQQLPWASFLNNRCPKIWENLLNQHFNPGICSVLTPDSLPAQIWITFKGNTSKFGFVFFFSFWECWALSLMGNISPKNDQPNWQRTRARDWTTSILHHPYFERTKT